MCSFHCYKLLVTEFISTPSWLSHFENDFWQKCKVLLMIQQEFYDYHLETALIEYTLVPLLLTDRGTEKLLGCRVTSLLSLISASCNHVINEYNLQYCSGGVCRLAMCAYLHWCTYGVHLFEIWSTTTYTTVSRYNLCYARMCRLWYGLYHLSRLHNVTIINYEFLHSNYWCVNLHSFMVAYTSGLTIHTHMLTLNDHAQFCSLNACSVECCSATVCNVIHMYFWICSSCKC